MQRPAVAAGKGIANRKQTTLVKTLVQCENGKAKKTFIKRLPRDIFVS